MNLRLFLVYAVAFGGICLVKSSSFAAVKKAESTIGEGAEVPKYSPPEAAAIVNLLRAQSALAAEMANSKAPASQSIKSRLDGLNQEEAAVFSKIQRSRRKPKTQGFLRVTNGKNPTTGTPEENSAALRIAAE